MTTLVLASASPARRAVLRSAGIKPVVRVSHVDEDAIGAALGPETPPDDIVIALAQAKALKVATALATSRDELAKDAVVVGCDSMLLLDGELQGKPHTPEVALARWHTMAGRSAELLTGHSVLRLRAGHLIGEATAASRTTVRFSKPDPEELAAYIATKEPLGVAGGFTLDGLGGWFVEGIDGDPSSVIGIGLPLLRQLLRQLGVPIAQLWNAPEAPQA